jgi:hypothetical protein
MDSYVEKYDDNSYLPHDRGGPPQRALKIFLSFSMCVIIHMNDELNMLENIQVLIDKNIIIMRIIMIKCILQNNDDDHIIINQNKCRLTINTY